MVDDSAPESVAMILAFPEQRNGVVLVRLDHRVGLSGEDHGQMLDLEVFRQGFDQPDHKTHFLPAVESGLGMDTVVAHAAVILRIILSEVIEQHLPAALAGLSVRHCLHQQLPANLLLRDRFSEHEFLKFLDVLVAVICDAVRQLAISSGAAGLLVISLNALGNVVVDHETDVRLVDTHSEGNRGDDDVHIFHQETVLVFRSRLGIQSRMVGKGAYPIDGQETGSLFHLLPAKTVDNPGLARMLLDIANDVFLGVHLVPHFIVEVRPVEGGLEHCGVHYTEILLDVALDLRGRRRGQGYHGRFTDRLDHIPYAAVLRAEIMSPFGDTMGLINSVKGYFDFFEEVDVLILGQGLGRHVKEFRDSGQKILADLLDLRLAE